MKPKQDRKAPFFARFLENQKDQEEKYPRVKSKVRAGKPDQTMKAPSDKDEI